MGEVVGAIFSPAATLIPSSPLTPTFHSPFSISNILFFPHFLYCSFSLFSSLSSSTSLLPPPFFSSSTTFFFLTFGSPMREIFAQADENLCFLESIVTRSLELELTYFCLCLI
ncbi:hypothetical protein ES332_D08G093100v1 [Gossypium tomentosum]|uniref:Uncharacterized protein n=1 Tax=Gossypium tomentosum TaxID=34277 RepID=A0A5D2JSG2_GOSTO|nr:hypothetical protein ES332_D08G093100v1 [Gossypium tomentosum]